jgi:hypothetical protein
MFILNNTETNRYNEYSMSVHLSKLKNIKGRKALISSFTPVPPTRSNRKYFHQRNLQTERNEELETKNKAMFVKLSKITQTTTVII